MVGACYAGAAEDGIEVVRPLKEFGTPIVDLLEPKPYTALQSMFDPSVPHGWHYYWKSLEPPPLTDAAIDTLVEHASALTSPKSYCIVFQLGGALARVGEDETAYSQRDAAHNVNINAVWTEDDVEGERHVAWAREFFSAMQPHAGGRVYLNFLGDEGADRVRQAYGDRQRRAPSQVEADIRPDELLPHEPEHLADRLGDRDARSSALRRLHGRRPPVPTPPSPRADWLTNRSFSVAVLSSRSKGRTCRAGVPGSLVGDQSSTPRRLRGSVPPPREAGAGSSFGRAGAQVWTNQSLETNRARLPPDAAGRWWFGSGPDSPFLARWAAGSGADPCSSLALACRAQQLCQPTLRREPAGEVEWAVEEARRPAAWRIALNQPSISECRPCCWVSPRISAGPVLCMRAALLLCDC